MAMFSRTEQLNSAFSCNTTPTWRRSCVGRGDVLSVHEHPSRLRRVQPLQQLGQRALLEPLRPTCNEVAVRPAMTCCGSHPSLPLCEQRVMAATGRSRQNSARRIDCA